MAHITSLVVKKVQFNHFPIISLWKISRGRPPNFSLFRIVLSHVTFVPNYSPTAPVVLEELSFKKVFFFFFFFFQISNFQISK